MTLKELFLSSGGILIAALALIQISPIKVDPFGALARWIGRALNGDVLKKLDEMEKAQAETREQLDEHIRIDNERNADVHRVQILRFNRELLQEVPHTQEDFVEALSEIDFYEHYCKSHPEYENNRAVLVIENIKRAYMEWQENHKVLEEDM